MTYGKVGTSGASQVKDHGSAANALKFLTKTSNEKQKKGYAECSDPDGGSDAAIKAEPAVSKGSAAMENVVPAAASASESNPSAMAKSVTIVKAKTQKFPVATVPSCVAALGDAELICFHGMFDEEESQQEDDEDESQQEDEEENDEQERGFYISVINAKTFRVIKTTKLELPEHCCNLRDCEQVDPTYTLITISQSKRLLAVTLGHEDYSAVLIVDLSDMSVKHVEENVEQHDQVRVVFLSDTAALITSCGNEYSAWRKVTNWADEAADEGEHSYELFEGDEEAGVSFLILGSNSEQTQYAVRKRYLPEEHQEDRGSLKNYRNEILIHDINTDEVVRTISLYGRSLAANVAISGDFETLWDWFGAEDYRCYNVDDGEAKIWRTALSSEATVQLSGADSEEETDSLWDTPCDFIHVHNVFFKQSLCDGNVEDEVIGDFKANIQLTEDKGHFVVGNGAGVLKIFSANTGALEVCTETGKENEWDVFSSTFYREQYRAVLSGNKHMPLFGFDAESTRSVFSVAVPAPSTAAQRAVKSKSSRTRGDVAATVGFKRAVPLSDSATASAAAATVEEASVPPQKVVRKTAAAPALVGSRRSRRGAL